MKLSFYAYRLLFKYPFRIAHGIRSSTDVVYVKLQHEGFTAWGEAALPPYLPETQKSAIEFLTAFSKTVSSNSIDDWFVKLKDESENICAKAALDIALWNLKSQMENKSIAQLLRIVSNKKGENILPLAAYTLGISSFDEMKRKIEEAKNYGFQFFKIKLNGENDEQVIKDFKKFSNDSFAVDVNQGWKNADEALRHPD